MKLMVSERWKREICPFCKDGFEQGDTRICVGCSTMMHQECFQENGGCAVPGCHEKSEDWPTCSQCDERLAKLSAVFCIHCGYDQENGRYIEGVPRPRGERAEQESRIVLENAKEVDWDLPNRPVREAADDGISRLKMGLWFGVALFGVLTVFTNFSRPHNNYFTLSLFCLLADGFFLTLLNSLAPEE